MNPSEPVPAGPDFAALASAVLPEISALIESARHRVVATANLELVSLYWNIGRIIDREAGRAGYGKQVIENLAIHLTRQYGRGFATTSLWDMRRFHRTFQILRAVSGELQNTVTVQLKYENASNDGRVAIDFQKHAHLGWAHYALLLRDKDLSRRQFYFDQAASQRWSTRELSRQMDAALYERVALSRDSAKLIAIEKKGPKRELIHYEDAFKDPYLLNFLGLQDAYSEKDLEAAIIQNLQKFLSELGSDFCFVGRQYPMRVDDRDYFLDLLFFHRGLRCLVAIDLKLGAFTAADKGQMDLYLAWLKKHEVRKGEKEPVGLILCSSKRRQHVELLLQGGPHRMQVSEYVTQLPSREVLEERLKLYSQYLSQEESV